VTHHITGLLAFAKGDDAVDHKLCHSITVEISYNSSDKAKSRMLRRDWIIDVFASTHADSTYL